ncbi:hypothetical protein [Paramaledivibacter caminithermalis]|nr:hypothetical protein [Paramaledivibacter caminithermalis]
MERLFIIAFTLITINIFKYTKFKFNYISLIFCGLILGYILGNILLYYSVIRSYEGCNNQNRFERNKERLSKPAVIIYSPGEPPIFDFSIIFRNVYSKKSIIKKINAPIEVFKFKIAYENMGSSKYVDLCNRIEDNLRLRLGEGYDLHSAYSNTIPFINEELNRLSHDYEKIILVPLMLSETEDYRTLKDIIDKNYANSDIEIKITPFLWKSKKLLTQITEKVIRKAGNEKMDSTGVILLMSNTENPYKQSVFSNEVIRRIEKLRLEKDRIIRIRFDDEKSHIIRSIKKLKGRGVENIIISSVLNFHDNIIDQYKMNKLIEKTAKKESINIYYINGWGIGENLLNELEYKIRITNLKD